MDKYLFTDSTNEIKEACSKEELFAYINSSPDNSKVRIWIFNSNEWLTYPAFLKKYPDRKTTSPGKLVSTAPNPVAPKNGKLHWIKKTFLLTGALAGALLIFNFTSAKWEKANPLRSSAGRPANVPLMDIDSLITEIESTRGKLIDKGTRYNLRLRNNWPEYILLHLDAEKETKGTLSSFFNVSVSIDNATGFSLDNAEIKLQVWKNGKADRSQRLQFNTIAYGKPSIETLTGPFRGDSLSVSFQSIKAKAFNFCYSSSAKNNSGNYNDRWFCRDGKANE
jgi:hypothetical protein